MSERPFILPALRARGAMGEAGGSAARRRGHWGIRGAPARNAAPASGAASHELPLREVRLRMDSIHFGKVLIRGAGSGRANRSMALIGVLI